LAEIAPALVGTSAPPAARTGAVDVTLEDVVPALVGGYTPPPRFGVIDVTLDSAEMVMYAYLASGVRLATPTMIRSADDVLSRLTDQPLSRSGDGNLNR